MPHSARSALLVTIYGIQAVWCALVAFGFGTFFATEIYAVPHHQLGWKILLGCVFAIAAIFLARAVALLIREWRHW